MLTRVKEDSRLWIAQGTLNIRRVMFTDAGKYQCLVRNSIGEKRIETALVVTAPLQVSLYPQQQILNIGQELTFNCNVSGYPVHNVGWKKDNLNLVVTTRVQLLSRDVLHITSVRREDKGMYQCFAYNEMDSAQGTAELKIADVAPSLLSVFPEHTAHSGERVSLKCISTGNPVPHVAWMLDGNILSPNPRITTESYATEHGHVVSYLNITETRVEDSGEYRCHVRNDVGSSFHAARLNIYGPPFVRSLRNVTAISGEELIIRCPYGGYPIKGIRWYKSDIVLPLNHRQKVNHGGILSIQNVERAADEGEYTCRVIGPDEQSASGSTHVSVVVSPEIDAHFFRESATVDKSSRTKLMCVVTKGDPPLRFHWLKNGHTFLAHGDTTVQTFEDSSIVTFKKVSSDDRGQYTCVATNIAASTNMTMQLIVNVPPQWTVEPRDSTAVLGSTVWMDCAAVGFPAPNILWKKMIYTESTAGDFTYVHSSPRAHRYNNGTLVLADVEENDAGSYLCQANNGIGAGLSKIVTLQVLIPPRFQESYHSQSAVEGSNATLKCVAIGHSPITITWMKDKTTLDPEISSKYSIRVVSDKLETTSELHINNSTRNDTGMYACAAVSDIGQDEVTIQFVVQGQPDAPTNVTIINVTSRSVSLQWQVLHNGNSHITGSVIQYQTDSDNNWNGQTSQLIVSGADTSATLRSLRPITTYYIRIIEENALGHSKPSEVLNVTTNEEVPSAAPQDVQVHSTGAQSMKVLWKPPPEDTRNGYIKGYEVGYKRYSSSEQYHYKKVEHAEGESQSTYITGLQPFTKYDIVVKAYNSAGVGPKSDKVMGTTLETAPPTSPIVQVTSRTVSSIEVRWEKDAKDKSAITDYTLHYKTDDGEWQQEHLSTLKDSHTLTGLKCGTKYHLFMTASNSLGTGEPSLQVSVRTKGAAPMSPAENVFTSPNTTFTTLHLNTWQSGGCPIQYFVVQHKPKYQNQWTKISGHLEMPIDNYVIRHLSPDRQYVVVVTAYSEAGMTQGEYHFRTLSSVSVAPTSSPAFGKRETDLPFYKNVALVIPVVVSSLVLIIVIFTVVVCLRKHSQDRRGRLDYETGKSCSDSLVMADINKQVHMKSKSSHYSCPTGNKPEYAEPYTCNNSTRQVDGLFATIKRCPTRPIYMSASYKQGSDVSGQPMSAHEGSTNTSHSEVGSGEKWTNQSSNSHKPLR